MAVTKTLIDLDKLGEYDVLIKNWANSAEQLGYKTIKKSADGNSLLLFKKPNAVVGTDTADATVPLGNSDMQEQLDALASVVGADWDSTNEVYTITLDNTFGTGVDTVVEALNELKSQINTLNGPDSTTGSVAKAIKDAIEALDVTEFALAEKDSTTNVITVHGISETDGKIAVGANSGNDMTFAPVAATGEADDVTTTAITDGAATPTTLYAAGNVQGILEAIARDLNDLEDESKVTVEKQTTADSGYAATYVIKQNNVQVGDKINIPLDYLVKGAEVKTVTTANVPYQGAEVGDKYIDFTINVKTGTGGTEEHLYIPVDDLMAAITGGTTAEATVSISASNEITVTIVKIAASKIAYSNTTSGTAVEENVQAALARIDGDDTTAGSIKKAVKDAVSALDTATDVAIATYTAGSGSTADKIVFNGSIAETDGVITDGSATDLEFEFATTADINALFA